MRAPSWIVVALALGLLAPNAALGAKLEVVGGNQFHYVAGPGELNSNYVSTFDQKVMIQEGENYGVVAVETVSPCSAEPQVAVMTPRYSCPAAGITQVSIEMGDQNDRLTFGAMGSFLLPVTVDAGDGNDDIYSRQGLQDKIDCGPGTDQVRADLNDLLANCENVERPSNGGETWTRSDGKPIGVSVNGGATYTNKPLVGVTVYGPDGASEILVSNDGGFAAPVSVPATLTTFPWRLPETGAERLPKTVYVRFGGTGIDSTRTFSDDIILDQTAPVISLARLRGDKLLVRASDRTSGLAAMQWRFKRGGKGSSFRPFASKLRVHGRIPRFVRVRDRAANLSRWRAISR